MTDVTVQYGRHLIWDNTHKPNFDLISFLRCITKSHQNVVCLHVTWKLPQLQLYYLFLLVYRDAILAPVSYTCPWSPVQWPLQAIIMKNENKINIATTQTNTNTLSNAVLQFSQQLYACKHNCTQTQCFTFF